MLTEQTLAPDFALLDQTGTERSLASFRGQWVLIYFYPKDDTPGCTVEACSFRDAEHELARHGLQVIGISKDSVESHDKFVQKYQLPFVLLADPEKKVIMAYSAGGAFTRRISYLVDPQGLIQKAYGKVDVKNHAAEVLQDVATLKAK